MEHDENQEKREQINGALRGVVLQITTRYKQEYEYDVTVSQVNNSDGKSEYILVGGYSIDVFFYLQSLLQFNYTLRPDVAADKFDKASVANASIDLYLASFSLLPDRVKYLEPTFVYAQSRILAFMDHSFEGDNAGDIFLTPFTSRLWACVILMLIIFIVSFLIFTYFELESVMGMGDMVFYCISVSLQKGSDNSFFRNSTRMASTILSFSVVIIMASYSGIMTSIFAVNRYTINSIEALTHSNYRILLEYGFNTESTIKFMLQQLVNLSSVAELLRRAEKSNFVFISFNDAIKEVKRTPSAYIIDEETGLDAISREWGGFPCTFDKISVFKLQYPWVMYMRKHATFHRPINSGIVRIRERGVLSRIRKKWMSQPPSSCVSGNDVPFKSIAFNQVKSAFTALVVVVVVACPVLFLAEKCFALVMLYLRNRVVAPLKSASQLINSYGYM